VDRLTLWEATLLLAALAARRAEAMREHVRTLALLGVCPPDRAAAVERHLERRISFGCPLRSAADQLAGVARERLDALRNQMRKDPNGR